jgi:hypothetical protein
MKRILLLVFIFPACLWAYDFGVTFNQDLGFGGIGGNIETDNSSGFIPWFSTSLGDSMDLFVSASVKGVFEYKNWLFAPELLHAEFTWRFDNLKIMAGRIPYAAPLDFIVEGFFDGAQALYDTEIGTFNAGAWYTGLLYKRSANITMTQEDISSYYDNLDYGDPNTYFASRRILMALGWEHPAIAGMIRGKASVLGQIDVNDVDTPYNSMYISAKAAMPLKQFVISMGGCLQIAGDEQGIGLAGELGATWIAPTPFYSQLSFIGKFSSGKTDSIYPFVPVTTKLQGNVLQAKLSGISALSLDYTARVYPTVSAGLTASYFIRGDEETYNSVDINGSASGFELFGKAAWNPFTDLSLTMGAGFFLPSIPKADTQWRLELGIVLVVF